ncbi:MAG TPA: sigma 54-interacting transcriptional regulator [Geopsychrobacteraceae bacterium]|jgi:transcriptional regulator with PAS, ATPase and Fis domain/iron only hydrogenase large subunit-like protein
MVKTEGRGPIKTVRERCRKCYACIRSCPTKAIAVRKDCAEVLHQRCIGCGNCIQACSQNAKVIADAIGETETHLKSSDAVVAVMGCSYPAFFYDLHPGQLVTALKKLGFSEVFEGAAGVELIAPEYRQLLEKNLGTTLISSHCPTIVDLIERHYPQLLRDLVPVVSPMIAIGRFIKACRGPQTRVVYISSCIGGKFEIESETVEGAVDTVLTYKELNRILALQQIDPHRLPQSPFSGKPTSQGRCFSIYGGPLHVFGIDHNGLDPDFVATVGEQASMEVIRDLSARRISPRYVDVRFCNGGCIGGPGRTNRLTSFSKRKLIIDYHRREIPYLTGKSDRCPEQTLQLQRGFSNKRKQLELPGGDAVKRILQETNKFTKQDELNCAGCGYATCREHAVAVYQGLADIRMCLHYSLKRLEEDRSTLEQKYELARRALDQEYDGSAIIGNDPRTQGVLQLIKQVGPTPTTTLIRGESGTGKELTARAIHQASLRADKPLVTVNCTTLSDSLLESELFGHKKGSFTGAIGDKKGLFEAANGGTIFLDEIGDITPKVQAELLRVLDSGEIRPVGSNTTINVDVRLIAATNKSLEAGISEGWFREDLFYRINVFTITLPPLRNRLHSIPKLVEHFLNRAARKLNIIIHKIDEQALEALTCYHWPGNIRELQNIIERAVVLSSDQTIHLEQLPVIFSDMVRKERPPLASEQPAGLRQRRDSQVDQVEAELLKNYLEKADGNVSAAARLAEIPRRSFYRMINRHGIVSQDFRKAKPEP